MEINKINSIYVNTSSYKKHSTTLSTTKTDLTVDSIKKYVDIAKVSPINIGALEILSKIELGDLYETLKEVLK